MSHPYAKYPPGQSSSSTTIVSSGGAFSPTSISGGQLWQDASTQTGSISTWASVNSTYFPFYMTGNSYVTRAALNGLSVLNFDSGGSYYMQMTPGSSTSSTFSFFFVSRQTGGANGRVFIGDGNTLYGYWGGYKRIFYFEGWVGSANIGSDSSWDLISIVRQSSGAVEVYWNGSLIVSVGSSGAGYQQMYINTGGCCGGEHSDAQVAEMIVYNTAASSTDRQKCEGYLAWKWGLQGNLPAGHPYKSAAP
jgi:hypothetical protein